MMMTMMIMMMMTMMIMMMIQNCLHTPSSDV